VIIKNRHELATSKLRSQALDIIEAGIERVLPTTIMHTSVSFDLSSRILFINSNSCPVTGRLFVVGGGKASGLMAETLEKIIPPEIITAGIVIDKADPAGFETRKVEIIRAGHPLPDERGVTAVRAILELKEKYSICEEDLVLCLISGGGSALMPCPADGLTLDDKQKITGILLSCGADIVEVNTIRKHLSRIKGGQLAQHLFPAGVLSLILSDVVGNDMSIIASGPTYPDPSTFADARSILERYGILDKAPENAVSRLEKGRLGRIEETPKSLRNTNNFIIGDNRLALEAMYEKAISLGFDPIIITSEQIGETGEIARQRAREILDGKYKSFNAIILGGETTPVLPDNHGKGGRNQHYAALTMLQFEKYPGEWLMAGVATDGSDYLPDIAGAFVDGSSLEALRMRNHDINQYLERYDSYPLLKEAGNSIIISGSTGTNVGDIILYLLP
jgi:glycerate-2-kinase